MLRFPGFSLPNRNFIEPELASQGAVLARTNEIASHNWAAIKWMFRLRTTGLEDLSCRGA